MNSLEQPNQQSKGGQTMFITTISATSTTPRIRMSVLCETLHVKGFGFGHVTGSTACADPKYVAKTAPTGIWAWSPPA